MGICDEILMRYAIGGQWYYISNSRGLNWSFAWGLAVSGLESTTVNNRQHRVVRMAKMLGLINTKNCCIANQIVNKAINSLAVLAGYRHIQSFHQLNDFCTHGRWRPRRTRRLLCNSQCCINNFSWNAEEHRRDSPSAPPAGLAQHRCPHAVEQIARRNLQILPSIRRCRANTSLPNVEAQLSSYLAGVRGTGVSGGHRDIQ